MMRHPCRRTTLTEKKTSQVVPLMEGLGFEAPAPVAADRMDAGFIAGLDRECGISGPEELPVSFRA